MLANFFVGACGSVNDRIVRLGRQLRLKTAQDARQFFVWRFCASVNVRILHLGRQMCFKTTPDARQFCVGVFAVP